MNVVSTTIAGLFLVELDVHADGRGNFREAYRADRFADHPVLSAFRPVQQNISHSVHGVIRGIHAEPWDKFIHIAYGEVFSAIVDLRPDEPTFGSHETFRLDHTNALFVSRGLGNAFQVVSEVAAYSYLVNAHWDASVPYEAIAFDDAEIGIVWPVADRVVSEKDMKNPTFEAFRATLS